MKNIFLSLSLMIVVVGLAVFSPWASSAAPATLPGVSDFSRYLLAEEDLLPLCDWYQDGLVVRPVRLGIMAYTAFSCATGPLKRSVHNVIIFTPRILEPGEGVILMGMADEGYKAPSQVGSWSQSISTMWDYHALNFTEGSAWVYVGPDMDYYDQWPPENFQFVIDLGEQVAGKLSEEMIPLNLPRLDSSQKVEPVTQGFFLEEPELVFQDDSASEAKNTLVIANGHGDLSFRVQYADPHDTLLLIFREEDGQLVHSWEFADEKQIAISLLEPKYNFSVMQYVDMAVEHFFREGTYVFQLWVDGVLIDERIFETIMK